MPMIDPFAYDGPYAMVDPMPIVAPIPILDPIPMAALIPMVDPIPMVDMVHINKFINIAKAKKNKQIKSHMLYTESLIFKYIYPCEKYYSSIISIETA